mmetsp:Transcript_478/g.698  ORF Transcript_478/g.698 Transcript_478/m.698 type:complete len:320 (-) Transcript_478:1653-2612(-)
MPPNVQSKIVVLPEEEKNTNTPSSVRQSWKCQPSVKSLRTRNPIREIVDPILAQYAREENKPETKKRLISLAVSGPDSFLLSYRSSKTILTSPTQLGDPTSESSLPSCPIALDAVQKALQTPSHVAGYVPACGTFEARQAIASFHSNQISRSISPDDVIVSSGCSGALELVLTCLLDEGSVLLVPRPGFPLYQVIAESHGADVVHYNLMPNNDWECDIQHLEQIIQENHGKVRAIVVTNPSNPTGSVYSPGHLKMISNLASRYFLPIVADEVYGDLTIAPHYFYSMGNIGSAPVIVTSGLAKQFLLPGWRVGWAVFVDK